MLAAGVEPATCPLTVVTFNLRPARAKLQTQNPALLAQASAPNQGTAQPPSVRPIGRAGMDLNEKLPLPSAAKTCSLSCQPEGVQDPLTPTLSPRGEGISSVLSPLGERDRVRGDSPKHPAPEKQPQSQRFTSSSAATASLGGPVWMLSRRQIRPGGHVAFKVFRRAPLPAAFRLPKGNLRTPARPDQNRSSVSGAGIVCTSAAHPLSGSPA